VYEKTKIVLVDVGGSGKQSLTYLPIFTIDNDVFQITISSSYGISELKNDLKKLYFQTGFKVNLQYFCLLIHKLFMKSF
jgi:dynein heavy chain